MPGSAYPGYGAQGPMPRGSSLDALATMLRVPVSSFDTGESQDDSYQEPESDPVSAASILRRGLFQQHVNDSMAPQVSPDPNAFPLAANPSGLGNRNQALSQGIADKYGVGGQLDPHSGANVARIGPNLANGSVSQQDLEALDTYMRGHDVADKSAIAAAPINARGPWDLQHARITGDYGLENRRLAEQGAENVAQINHANDMDKERLHGQMAIEAARLKQPEMGPDGMPVNTKPLGATEQRAIDSLHEGASLVGRLESVLDPSKSQPMDWLTTMGKYAAYKSGFGLDDKDQVRMQLAGLLKVLGAAPYVMGSRHYQYMQQAQEHLTSPSATDRSIWEQLQELKKIWPELQHDIITAHRTPGAPLDFGMPAGASSGGADLGPNW
jgi:hypothetical protein